MTSGRTLPSECRFRLPVYKSPDGVLIVGVTTSFVRHYDQMLIHEFEIERVVAQLSPP
jgi:hypothetical protein